MGYATGVRWRRLGAQYKNYTFGGLPFKVQRTASGAAVVWNEAAPIGTTAALEAIC